MQGISCTNFLSEYVKCSHDSPWRWLRQSIVMVSEWYVHQHRMQGGTNLICSEFAIPIPGLNHHLNGKQLLEFEFSQEGLLRTIIFGTYSQCKGAQRPGNRFQGYADLFG